MSNRKVIERYIIPGIGKIVITQGRLEKGRYQYNAFLNDTILNYGKSHSENLSEVRNNLVPYLLDKLPELKKERKDLQKKLNEFDEVILMINKNGSEKTLESYKTFKSKTIK